MSAATAGAPAGPTAAGSDAPSTLRLSTRALARSTSRPRAHRRARRRPLPRRGRRRRPDRRRLGAPSTARPSRIDVDLRSLDSFTDAGARALVGCRDLASHLPEGLHYRTGRGPGRDALLAAYTDPTADRQ